MRQASHPVPETAEVEVDTSPLANYSVRYPFELYGVTAYFNQHKVCVGMWWCKEQRLVTPNEYVFPHVAALFRSSVYTLITAATHLTHAHWIISNGLTLASERFLPITHPLRRLIAPHTFHTPVVNLVSTVLLAPLMGLGQRMFAFDDDSWPRVAADAIQGYRYETWEEHFVASGLPERFRVELPLYHDGFDEWAIHGKYVASYVNQAYPSDNDIRMDDDLRKYWNDFTHQLPGRDFGLGNLTRASLINHLTYFIFWVTGSHQYVGGLTEYLRDPSCPAPKLCMGSDVVLSDVQTFAQNLSLASLTGLDQPFLLNDWRLLHAGFPVELAQLDSWQDELKAFDSVVEKRNLSRSPFAAMRPSIQDSSVSI